ncbi:MAG: ROK family protein [Proteobacteria bacterium]|nr:MAG: ROK family protein [Pseudomonadota bacterium]
MPPNSYTIGIDLGGTKVAAALVDATGRILFETSRPTVPPEFKDADPRKLAKPSPSDVKLHIAYVINALADAALDCASALDKKEAKKLLGIGLASAGPMNIGKGEIIDPSNFNGWKKVAIVKLMAKACLKRGLKVPISFQNDAIAASLGEGWTGIAKGKQTYVVVTVGTGIGTGVILNGKPAQSNGMGSEWGHVISNSFGFLTSADKPYDREVEGIASGTGLVRQAKLRGLEFGHAHEIAEAARSGDKNALALFAGASEALAGLFYTLSLGFNPEVFAVSGGMIAIQDLFLPQAIALYNEAICVKYPSFKKQIKISKLGTKAGVIGAARLPRLEA